MIKNLNKKDWYYWGYWSQFVLFTSPWLESVNSEPYKKMGLSKIIKGDAMVLSGHYYYLKDDIDAACNIAEKKAQNQIQWFKKFFTMCEQKTEQMLQLKGRNDFRKFVNSMVDHFACSLLVELLDIWLEGYLKKLCKEHNIPMMALTLKMQPKKKTLLMQYNSELKKLNRNNIDSFLNKYKWVGTHALEGRLLTKEKVLDELKLISKDKKPERVTNIRIPNEFRKLIPIGSELIFHRSNLIETIDKVACSYRPIMKELGKKNGLSYFDIISLTHCEVIDLIDKGKIPEDLRKRKKKYGITFINGKYSVLLGKELKEALSIFQPKKRIQAMELEGIIAYPGHVKGFAKIMRTIKDASKVEKDDIIVAAETTPEYILAMRKAAAFVTNQGGITSHAAIIAREMKKPCIIGTKIATKVLKDGDLVEVDADKGVVKILKQKT